MKLCRKCDTVKPLSEFGKNRARKDGLQDLCKPCRNAYKIEWRRKNPEKRKEYDRRYYQKHGDKRREYAKEHYPPEYYAEVYKRWARNNPERVKYHKWRRKALEKQQLGHVSSDIECRLLTEQAGCCLYCGEVLKDYHLEHKIPLSRGGLHDDANLCLSCAGCNLRKHTKTSEEFMKEMSGDN